MKADDNTMSRTERQREHMEQVRAVLRRSAHERVLRHIRRIEGLQSMAEAGLRPPLYDFELEELRHLRVQRDAILAEMVAAGQVPG